MLVVNLNSVAGCMMLLMAVAMLCADSSLRVVYAHSEGVSHEQVVNTMLIDVGQDPVLVHEYETVRLDVELLDAATGFEVPYTSAWIRLGTQEKVLFATSIAPAAFGPTLVTLPAPAAGEYELSVRFESATSTLATAMFPIQIHGVKSRSMVNLLIGVSAGLIGIFIGARYARLTHRPSR